MGLVKLGRYDGAIYVCGYAVEIALKFRICHHLRWDGFPDSNQEFAGLQSFKTHDLESLLKLTGLRSRIEKEYLREWSIVTKWKPEMRYGKVGTTSRQEAELMLESTQTRFKTLCRS
jgi:HEPN domain-containing protein